MLHADIEAREVNVKDWLESNGLMNPFSEHNHHASWLGVVALEKIWI